MTKTAHFDPATITLMKMALDDAWNCLEREAQATVLKTTLAVRILETASCGERDFERLRNAALTGLAAWRQPRGRSRRPIFPYCEPWSSPIAQYAFANKASYPAQSPRSKFGRSIISYQLGIRVRRIGRRRAGWRAEVIASCHGCTLNLDEPVLCATSSIRLDIC